MMTKTSTATQSVIVLVCLLVLAACFPQQPIVVYVTPTPQNGVVLPTDAATATEEVAAADIPTVTPPPPVVTAGPSPTYLGAVIGADYTLPPTETPRPTDTLPPPTVGPTPTPAATNTSAGPAATALPGLDPARMGIQLDPTLDQTDWNAAVEDIHRLGVRWLKVQISWKQLQPNGAGEVSEDFRRLEIYLETAFNAGLDIMISIAKAPAWARTNQLEDGPPDNPEALGDFLRLILTEFGSSIDAIEVWNEPNLSREWQGKPLNGGAYMELFRAGYDAIRSYSPTMTIITAGLAPTQGAGAVDDRLYLQQMYDAGLSRYGDAVVGIHPYSWGNPPDATCCDPSPEPGWDDNPHFFFLDNINDYRDIMTRNGHSGSQLWTTEFGWATWDGFPGSPPEVWMGYNDRWKQGNYTLRAFQMGQERDFMGPMILWNLNFANEVSISNRDERAAYSLIIPGTPRERPAYWMIYDAIRPEVQLERYD